MEAELQFHPVVEFVFCIFLITGIAFFAVETYSTIIQEIRIERMGEELESLLDMLIK